MGLFSVSKSSTTLQQATTNNFDQRQVNDQSGNSGAIGTGNAVNSGNAINSGNTVTNIGTDPGVAHIAELNDQLLATLGDQQGDAMKVIAGLGAGNLKALGESATNLFGQAEQNSAQAWTNTLDVSKDALDKAFSAASGVLTASTSLAQGAMSTYQPADSKASDNQTKVAILGVIAIIVAAFIQAKKG